MFERFAHLPWLASALLCLLLCSYQALRFLLFGWAVRRVRVRSDVPLALLAPVLMVTSELCVPFVFPYYLALTQAWQTPVIQVAELTGPLGVTALLLMSSGAVYDAAVGRRRRLTAVLTSAMILAAALCFGHLRIRQVGERRVSAPTIKVGVVQPNIPSAQMSGGLFAAWRLAELQRKSAELESAGADASMFPIACSRRYESAVVTVTLP
jgi:apolipoprotein N-acyltransferase